MIHIYGPTHGSKSVMNAFTSFLKLNTGEDFRIIDDIKEITINHKKDIVLCGIPVNNYKKNHQIIDYLKNLKCNIYFLLDHWHNSSRNFIDIENKKKFLPNKIFCIDQSMYEKYLINGIDKDSIEFFGHPSLEHTYLNNPNNSELLKLKRKIGIDKECKIISVFLDPIGNKKECYGYNEIDVINMLKKHSHDHTFVIKPHPRSNYQNIVDNSNKRFRFIKNIDPFDLLYASDTVLGMTSIMLAHSMALKKKTGSIQINVTPDGKKRSNIYYDDIIIKNNHDLELFLNHPYTVPNNICKYKNVCSNIYKTIKKE